MMRSALAAVCVVGMVCLVGPSARGEAITLTPSTLSGLLGGTPVAVDSLLTTPMDSDNLHNVVYSQAYTYDESMYAYLYQVKNTGTLGVDAETEVFTVWPFCGSLASGDVGYLTDTPTGFLSGGLLPESQGAIKDLAAGWKTTFYYTTRADAEIDPGEHSVVLYIMSTCPPGLVTGSVINGTVASGDVVGAVPEPATVVMLIGGGLSLLICAWGRRRSARSA